jgi:hypothetical protein
MFDVLIDTLGVPCSIIGSYLFANETFLGVTLLEHVAKRITGA